MKVLYYVGYPLEWAKGGHAIFVRETVREVQKLGIETEWLHHEATEPMHADILHYFARPPSDMHWQLAKQRGMKIVVDELHQIGVLRPRWTWYIRGAIANVFPRVIGRGLYSTMGLEAYRHADAALAVTPAEADYIRIVMGTPSDRIHIVPSGVDDIFFDGQSGAEPFDGILYVGYICQRKNSLEVARLARKAQIPVKFVGGALVADDAYVRSFAREVDNRFVFWEKEVTDRRRLAAMYRGAKGTVLASRNEGLPLCLLESLAAGTPIMAPDIPNLRAHFKDSVRYTPAPEHPAFAESLRSFYDACSKGLKQDVHPVSWSGAARLTANVYRTIMERS